MKHKRLTEAGSVDEALKILDDRVDEAMKPVGALDMSSFTDFLSSSGGAIPQPFPEEPKPPRAKRPPRLSLS